MVLLYSRDILHNSARSHWSLRDHMTYEKKLFPAKSLWAGNTAKSVTSEGNSAHKLVVSRNFLFIRIVLSCFCPLIFYFEKFSIWIWRLPFAVCVKLKLSNNSVFNNTPYLESVPASSLSEFSEFKLVYIVSKRKLKVFISSVLCAKIYPAPLDAGA